MMIASLSAGLQLANAASFILLAPGQSLAAYFSCSAIYALALWTNLWVVPAGWLFDNDHIDRVRTGQLVVVGTATAGLLVTHFEPIGAAFALLLLVDTFIFVSFPMLYASKTGLSQRIDLARACIGTLTLVITVAAFDRSPVAFCFVLVVGMAGLALALALTGWYRPPPLRWSSISVVAVAKDIVRAFSGVRVKALLGARIVEVVTILTLSAFGKIGVIIALKLGLAIASVLLSNARSYSIRFLTVVQILTYPVVLGGVFVYVWLLPGWAPAALHLVTPAGILIAMPIVLLFFGLILAGIQPAPVVRTAPAGEGSTD